MDPVVLYREATDDDLAFILKSWLKAYSLSKFAGEMRPEVFYDEHKRVVMRLVAVSTTIVVCDPEDPSHIFGYCCFSLSPEAVVFHFIYFKSMYRGLGMARNLLAAMALPELAPRYATHANRCFHAMKERYRVEYNPYLISQILAKGAVNQTF